MSRPMRTVLALLALFVFSIPPAGAVEVQRVETPLGFALWMVRDTSIPVVAVEVSISGGSASDPAGKQGLAAMAAELLSESVGPYDAQAFAALVEDASIDLSVSAGGDFLRAGFRVPTRNLDEAFRLLGLMLTEPRFEPSDTERVRQQLLSGLSRAERDPNSVASRAWYAAAYPEHPYGRPSRGTAATLGGITRDDLVAFAKGRFAREALKIGVVGDIDAATAARLVDAAFGALPIKAVPGTVKTTPPLAAGDVMVVDRPVPQSVVIFGQAGIARSDPDFMATFILNRIIGGGGFGSRLMAEIRERRGLTYGIYTYLSTPQHSGVWLGSVSADNAKVAEVIGLIRELWTGLRDKGITAEELDEAKRYLTGSFARGFATTRGIAGALVGWQEDGVGIDYFQRRNGLVEAVTLDDVNRIARNLVAPEKLMFVVVGQPQGVVATRPTPDRG